MHYVPKLNGGCGGLPCTAAVPLPICDGPGGRRAKKEENAPRHDGGVRIMGGKEMGWLWNRDSSFEITQS